MQPTALFQYQLPLDTPIRFAGQQLSERQGLLLKFEHQGRTAYGDCCPLPGFSQDSLAQNRDALLAFCKGELSTEALPAAARFALDSGRWLADNTTALIPEPVPLLAGTPEQMLAQLNALDTPPQRVKLKLARHPLEQEITLVHQLLSERPHLRLRGDANRGWSYEQAATFAASVPTDRFDFVEEPCADLMDSLRLYQQHRLPIALDETTQAADYQYQSLPGVVALVLKPTLIGSLAQLQQLIEQAELDGVHCILSSSFESNLGLAALAALARELTPEQPPGLDTLDATAADLCQPNLWQRDRPLIPEAELERLF
ncbi:o-succinylbenzoate synthase [Ferrimonas marina]|uniref:o-succinylbenzoate synthase n=1 Tax=Ferrimonas marina TaxID=299255 RepID=A0A1M5ZBF0_9GAMM|nr:o-succinylbenzoate synthase [Ferrimonas marina]SHI21540.1 O-succinylbenzoate synthase [Ferrimonas marina]